MSMKRYSVLPYESTLLDVDAITGYIAYQLLAPITSDRTRVLLRDAFAALEYMPQRWPRIGEEISPGLTRRKMSIKNYIIIFMVDELSATVYVERVLGSQQDWENLL